MNDFRADLHCHSTYSDGTATPQELIDLALSSGLKGLSITDHDTTQAYLSALSYAKDLPLELIPGVEFSATLDNVSVHVLGYSFSPFHSKILSLCTQHSMRRDARNREILERLSKLGISITPEDIIKASKSKLETIGRPHIAKALVQKGYVPTIKEAFKLYLGEGKSAYAKGMSLSVEETIETLHKANGLAIIAHPHLIEHPKVIHKLLEMNFDGLEGYYGNFNKEENARWTKIAQKKGWLITGGSDYHGEIKPNIYLGSSWISQDLFRILQERYLRNAP
jgi:predicted metal-dependent phosphoesterase TrpH